MGICGSKEDVSQQPQDAARSPRPEPGIHELYREGRELGRGHFARVVECTRIADGKRFAMKMIAKKEMVSQDVVRKEIAILRKVGQHQYIVSLVDVQEDRKHFYLIMDLCPGGDLFSKIVEEGNYSEEQARKTCKQLASALMWIHKKGVTHRDLKPENILLVENDLSSDIKVADFGLSKLMKPNQEIMKTVCGTWAYCAPEVLKKVAYKQDVDCWTLGVLMYILLSGYHPFDVYGDLNEKDLMDKIQACEYDFNDPVWANVSDSAKDLIKKLLKIDTKSRLSLQDFMNSAWIQNVQTEEKKGTRNTMVAERLAKFNDSKFRMVVDAGQTVLEQGAIAAQAGEVAAQVGGMILEEKDPVG